MVHIKISFPGIATNARRSMHAMDVSSENYMYTIHDLIRHRLNIDELLTIDIWMQNPESGSRGLVRLSSTFNENMELGSVLMNFDEDVYNEVMFNREDLYVTIRAHNRLDMSPVLQQNIPAPLPISAPCLSSSVSRQSMSHRPYA